MRLLIFIFGLIGSATSLAETRAGSVQPSLQKYFVTKFTEGNSCQSAYGVFSYSGWVDRGQVLVWNCGKQSRVEFLAPGEKKPKFEFVTDDCKTIHEFAKGMKDLKFVDLPNSRVMDGTQYSVVSLRRDEKKKVMMKRFFTNNPERSRLKYAKKQSEVIEFFYALAKPKAAKKK